jgi:hypothetical protein
MILCGMLDLCRIFFWRERARAALANEAARRYSWETVAKGVIAAAQGRLAELPRPAMPAVGLRAP